MGGYSLTPLEKISSKDLVKYKSRGGEERTNEGKKGETDERKNGFVQQIEKYLYRCQILRLICLYLIAYK